MSTSPLPLRFDYLATWQAVLLYAALAIPILWLGYRSMTGLDSFRKWTSIAIRLDLLMFLVLLLAGARWEQTPKDLTVVVVRDVSRSTTNVRPTRAGEVQQQVALYLREATRSKPTGDRLGTVSFDRLALVDALPNAAPTDSGHGMRTSVDGTDVAQALGMAMATMPGDTMRRMALLWDGNRTAGDIDTAVDAAAAQHIPIDVVPLNYEVDREIAIERLVVPASRRENEPLTLDLLTRSQNPGEVSATLSVSDNGAPLDLDPHQSGADRSLHLAPGSHIEHIALPPLSAGVHRIHLALQPAGACDTIRDNNTADAITIVRGAAKLLLVDGNGCIDGRTSSNLHDILARAGFSVDELSDPALVPRSLPELAQYDTIVLMNVARGYNGLDDTQDRALAAYVRDLGGGLVMVGGPSAFGAGGWGPASALASVLPVDCQPNSGDDPPGSLVLAIDHSASMGEAMRGTSMTKLDAAREAAVSTLRTLLPDDRVGVLAFDTQCTWLAPLAENHYPDTTAAAIRRITAAGNTSLHAALTSAHDALSRVPRVVSPVRHIVLLTDGRCNDADFIALLAKLQFDGITVSTIGIGTDIDERLLSFLAWMGHGKFYRVSDPSLLRQVFIREANTLRDALVEERPIVPRLMKRSTAMNGALPNLHGMVVTRAKALPGVETPIIADDTGEPILAHWRCGLGQVSAFTSDGGQRWAREWKGELADRFWTEAVRGVTRRQSPAGVSARIVPLGPERAKLVVETTTGNLASASTPARQAAVVGPDDHQPACEVRLRRSASGTYEGEFATPDSGAYLAAVPFDGEMAGTVIAAHVSGGSRELRDLSSNEQAVRDVARRTGGRVLSLLDPSVDLFDRADLSPQPVSLPLTDKLVALAIFTLLLDVAVRRLAWDRSTLAHAREVVAESIRAFTHVRVGDPEFSVGALMYVHLTMKEDGWHEHHAPDRAAAMSLSQARLSPRFPGGRLAPQSPARDEALPATNRIHSPAPTLDALLASHRRRAVESHPREIASRNSATVTND